MHKGCTNPVWPCAMTGAVACLAGFSGFGVLVHGSSGCFYYTEALVPVPIHSTFLLEEEVIFGAEDRLREVVEEIAGRYERIAVVNTCVPSVMGEDIKQFLDGYNVTIVDLPGFEGEMEFGYRHALENLDPRVESGSEGVNIDGLCLIDPFCRGNLMEAERLLRAAGLKRATAFCADTLAHAYRAAPLTIETNPDLASGIGTSAGSLLGFAHLRDTFRKLEVMTDTACIDPVMKEIEETEERVIHACDRHLRRFDPPTAAIFATAAYAEAAAELLKTYLDADIAVVATRNNPSLRDLDAEETIDLGTIQAQIDRVQPDLVIGSSFEHAYAREAVFFGLIQPSRGRVHLHHPPFIGCEGALYFMESVLNGCIDYQRDRKSIRHDQSKS